MSVVTGEAPMKHMAIVGLMLAFALPAAPAETETQQERQARA